MTDATPFSADQISAIEAEVARRLQEVMTIQDVIIMAMASLAEAPTPTRRSGTAVAIRRAWPVNRFPSRRV